MPFGWSFDGYILGIIRCLVKSVYQKKKNSYFSSKTYVVGTQKNRLNETALLSTKKYVKTDG